MSHVAARFPSPRNFLLLLLFVCLAAACGGETPDAGGDGGKADAPGDVDASCEDTGTCECEPACTGRECGPDGCGGTCGSDCTGGQTCQDGQCLLGFRPHDGATARMRLINGDLLTSSAGRKVCLFGDDGDPRPYAVFNALGFSAGEVVTIDASYVEVPAGVALRASHALTVGAGSNGAEDCDPAAAEPLAPASLTEDGYYTLVARTYDEFFTRECAADPAQDYCEFYPRSASDEAEVPCADQGLFLFADGFQLSGDYYEAVRIVNLSSNAAAIGSSFQPGAQSLHGNAAGGSGVGVGYSPLPPGERLRICPAYLRCDPALSSLEETEAVLSCTSDDDSPWALAEVIDERLSQPERNTTVYVFGAAGALNAGGTGLADFGDLGIAIAHDVSDGPLP